MDTDEKFQEASPRTEAGPATAPPRPRGRFYQSPALQFAAGLSVMLAAIAGWNYYIASHRTVYIVHGLPDTTISVKVDDGQTIDVHTNERKEITLAEGLHNAEIVAPVPLPKVIFQFGASWWERFTRNPVYVLDPTRSAAVKWEETTYVPAGEGRPPNDRRIDLRLGEPFSSFKHVDYPFAEFPPQIPLKKMSGPASKTRVQIQSDDPGSIVEMALRSGTRPVAVLSYLEKHLQAQPDRENLLLHYTGCCMSAGKDRECRNFLRRRLADRPVRVEWHRWYQILTTSGQLQEKLRTSQDDLKQDYDQLLDAAPRDASLLYLRGRLEGRTQAARPFYERALAIEPNHPYALFASSHQRLVVGEFAESLNLLEQAIAAKPKDQEFTSGLNRIRLAAGDLAGLERSARANLRRDSLDYASLELLLKVLILTDRVDEADRELHTFSDSFRQQTPTTYHTIPDHLRWKFLANKGDFERLDREVGNRHDPAASRFAFFAKLGLDRLADVPIEASPSNTAYWHLCRALVARRLADEEQATQSRNVAVQMLDSGVCLDWYVADALRQSDTVTWDDLEGLGPAPSDKAIVLVTLAYERSDLRTRLLDLAEKVNFDLDFPHYILKREIADLRANPPLPPRTSSGGQGL